MNVSPGFSLPLRLIAPYFVAAVLFNIASMIFLFFLQSDIGLRDFRVIGWVHAYMIGFVMMSIIGAMAQLSVVVAEVHHRYPKVFAWIGPLLGAGTVVLVIGFIYNPFWLGIGGGLILCALAIFAFNLFITLRFSRRRTAVTRSMQWSTLFLGIGLMIGMMMALGYGGIIPVDPTHWRMGHIFAVFGGYVMINIMGVSTVLLPMFGACNRVSDNDYTVSFYTMVIAVGMMLFASVLQIEILEYVALWLGIGSVMYYMFRVYLIFTSRKRVYSDIWERSVSVAFIALALSVGSGVYGIVSGSEKAHMISFWFLTAGFLGFLITAHLYKIVPFLVWFERYAPYVDEREVPMLHQLLPAKLADIQWGFAVAGLVMIAAAMGTGINALWQIGAFLSVLSGGVLLAVLIRVLGDKL
ncbi:hypothetical protein Sulku_0254 [Sulfuricurvum kujiense DSM 16994]|uniref:Cbb3-type cytochrome c oxidase subunit I n=1 Tax=Sulfuricurvum kujiense (strain ATCC BAA-921 / DSM 16994 / JCM 11577 / YK-1) TaxID=709032 RepID=E4TY08_SULKY|nr:hypothetical protein [Sulfuricurvum kujiense]ADR32921.1 hypothetical protein Sulku_0254 [Sulfuricurvum kujiense DSM 16994]